MIYICLTKSESSSCWVAELLCWCLPGSMMLQKFVPGLSGWLQKKREKECHSVMQPKLIPALNFYVMSSPLQNDKQVKHTSKRLHQSHRAKGAPIMEVIISQCLGLGTWATCGLHAVSTSLTASSKNLTSRLCSARPRPLEAYSWTLAKAPNSEQFSFYFWRFLHWTIC